MSPPMSEADQFNANDQDRYLPVFKHMLNTCICLLYHILAELLLEKTNMCICGAIIFGTVHTLNTNLHISS